MQFDCLLIDPPWHYNFRGNLATKFRGGASQHYSLMKIEDLCALPVGELAAPRCVLFLWGVCPKTQEYLPRVLQAWKIPLATLGFGWEKINADGSPWWGPGYYTASNIEPLWLCARGEPRLKPAVRFNQVVRSAHPRDEKGAIVHSRKPEEFQHRIELMYPGLNKIELFARRERPGWTCIGNGIDGRDIADAMRELIDRPDPDFSGNGKHDLTAARLLPRPTQAGLDI